MVAILQEVQKQTSKKTYYHHYSVQRFHQNEGCIQNLNNSHLPFFCKFSLTLNCSSPSSNYFFRISLSLTPPLPLPYYSSLSPVLFYYLKFSKFLSITRTFFFSNLIFSSPSLSHVLSLILEGSRFF
jgi:hypothetical protein